MVSMPSDHSLIVDKLSSSGNEVATWSTIGKNPTVSSHVYSFRFTEQGYAYAFVSPGRVLKIDENGRALASWSVARLRRPLFRSPEESPWMDPAMCTYRTP